MERNSHKKSSIKHQVYWMCITLSFFLIFLPGGIYADRVDELEDQIKDRAEKIDQLEEEIEEYENRLVGIGAERTTLEGAVANLDASYNKLQTEVEVTQNKIASRNLSIEKLEIEIGEKQRRVEGNKDALRVSIRTLHQLNQTSLVESVLAHDSLSDVWETIDIHRQFQSTLEQDIQNLTSLRQALEANKTEEEAVKTELVGLRVDLQDQQLAVAATREEKNDLLKETKNEEAQYQSLLAEKRAARERFEQELADFEAQLAYELDESRIPSPGSGVLGWPVSDSFLAQCNGQESHFGNRQCITQYFGNTPFARGGAYNGNGHNGMDVGMSTGTPILSAQSGTVRSIGNTDQYSGCYSYGKWVLVDHHNGLSTLYAHLSSIAVSPGQSISFRERIGFSGNSGYSTGPHLHFTVYAQDGVRIVRLGDIKTVTNCPHAQVPVAPTDAYLNPLNYL